jgi:4-hydroxy-tetrahydrodipicolinate synthase
MTVFNGVFTALVTPFAEDGSIDEAAYANLIERQVAAGVTGIIPVGTTGESPTITITEHHWLIERTVELAAGRVLVVAGCGSNDTATAINHMRHAKTVGADAALIVAPYYNKPDPRALVAHFGALCDAVELPQIVYNIPGRTGIDISPETFAQIAQHRNIVGLKDSAGDPSRTAVHRRLCRPDIALLAGDDQHALGFGAFGAVGVVSVLSNIMPATCVALQKAIASGDFATARAINDRVDGLQRTLFKEPNPGPAKAVLAMMGLCRDTMRLPLLSPAEPTLTALEAACEALDLLSGKPQ